jgi:hypothetical protein
MQEELYMICYYQRLIANDKMGYTPEQLTCEERGVIYGAIL